MYYLEVVAVVKEDEVVLGLALLAEVAIALEDRDLQKMVFSCSP